MIHSYMLANYGGYIVAVFVMMLLSAFFSGTETSLVTSSRVYLEDLSSKDSTRARRALYLLDNIENSLSLILIGNNIVNIATGSIITFIATRAYQLNEPELLGVTVVQAIVFLLFCELIPKLVARARSESVLLFFSLPLVFLITALRPVLKVTLVVSEMLKNLMKLKEHTRSPVKSREEIAALFEIGKKEGVITKDDQSFVKEILSFKNLTAREVMTPTIDLESVEIGDSVKNLVNVIVRSKFSRIPVFQDRVDNIIGYVFYRDVIMNPEMKHISEILHRVSYIPLTKKVYEIYSEMRINMVPLYIVVDEYGAATGMVTHEDVAEEVVGEIQTSDQSDGNLVQEAGKNRFLVTGSLDIEYFMKKFNVQIEKAGFETLAGYVCYKLGRIPRRGERFQYDRFTFIVDQATERSVDRVLIVLTKKQKKAK